ncbi:hypothetical protein Vretimale_10061 [Volvox reticuliferus]|nr:hypothetical protein Vretimale_10061 [Volvox reticuliferus]
MIHSYTSLARLEAAAGDEAAARQHFKDGHAADPTHVPLLHAWATFELNCDKQSAARRLLTKALELDPSHVPSWMAMGTLEWRQGNPSKAREVFEKGLSVLGPSAPLLSALADLELRQMNIKNARELFFRLRTSTLRHVPSLLLEAKMEHRSGSRSRAQQLYLEAAAAVAAGVVCGSEGRLLQTSSPATGVAPVTFPGVLRDLAVAVRQQQGWQQQQQGREGEWRGEDQQQTRAEGSHGGAVAVAAVLHACAQMLLVEGDLARAEELLLAVEAVESNNGHMCHTRGLLCQREGNLAAAEQWFRRGLDCRTSRDGGLLCYEGLAELLAFQGRKEEARAAWQEGAVAVQPPTSRFLRQAALFEKKERNWAAAAALFADAVRRDPQDYRSWLQWGVFESRQRNWEAAERCFQRGTSVAPGYPYLWLAYVSSLVAQRRISDARVVLRTATHHCPRHAQLWMEWALMEAAAGNADMARQLFGKGAEVPPNYQHEPLYQAWAAFEAGMGNGDVAAQLMQRAEQVAQAHTARRLAVENKTVDGSSIGSTMNAAAGTHGGDGRVSGKPFGSV